MFGISPAENNGARWQRTEPDWKLFQDNHDIWDAVFQRCDEARHSIDME